MAGGILLNARRFGLAAIALLLFALATIGDARRRDASGADLTVEAETYVGLSPTGSAAAVDRVTAALAAD